MKLYDTDLSPFSARCRLVIYTKGLDVELTDPFSEVEPDNLEALTPLAKVPALETEDGWLLPESQTICEYLDEKYPEPPLMPVDLKERALVRLLARIGDLYLLEPLTVLFGNIDPAIRQTDKVDVAFNELETALGWLNHYLDGSGHAVGTKLSLADCALMPILFFVRRIPDLFGRSGCLLDSQPNATGYWRGIFAEPVVERVYDEMDAALRAMR